MSQLKKRIDKLTPVVRVRERELLLSRNELEAIRKHKNQMLSLLADSQNTYMQSVDKLNKIRSLGVEGLQSVALESSIEFVRNKWAEQLSELRRAERQERHQLAIVQDHEVKLRSVEKITEKYELCFKKERARLEQEHLDEFVTSRFGQRSR